MSKVLNPMEEQDVIDMLLPLIYGKDYIISWDNRLFQDKSIYYIGPGYFDNIPDIIKTINSRNNMVVVYDAKNWHGRNACLLVEIIPSLLEERNKKIKVLKDKLC